MIGRALNRLLVPLLLAIIWVYSRTISPLISANCRYQPTCSSYAREALLQHGAVKGSWLALQRIGRCHPWGGYGYDPVPVPVPEPERGPDDAK